MNLYAEVLPVVAVVVLLLGLFGLTEQLPYRIWMPLIALVPLETLWIWQLYAEPVSDRAFFVLFSASIYTGWLTLSYLYQCWKAAFADAEKQSGEPIHAGGSDRRPGNRYEQRIRLNGLYRDMKQEAHISLQKLDYCRERYIQRIFDYFGISEDRLYEALIVLRGCCDDDVSTAHVIVRKVDEYNAWLEAAQNSMHPVLVVERNGSQTVRFTDFDELAKSLQEVQSLAAEIIATEARLRSS